VFDLVQFDEILKKWRKFFEVEDGESRNLGKYTLCCTAITRNEFLVVNFQLKM